MRPRCDSIALVPERRTNEVTAESLEGFAMLDGVSLTARRELLAASELRELDNGEPLIEQGSRNDAMYLLLEGELGVHLDQVEGDPVAVIGPGETVGEISMLDGSEASAHVVARARSRLLAISEEGFWQLTNASHAFAVNLLTKLAARLRANNATVSRNVQKRRQYERAAMFDGLTGIHNRRWLDDTLHRMVGRYQGTGRSLSLSLIDIDHFKSFNDRFGHAAGDHVLTVVAAALAAHVRPTDLVARFGGEEFVLIFPDTDVERAAKVAERVRQAVSEQRLVMPDGTALPQVTISMGVTEITASQSVPDFLKVADMAMYEAKQSGRNRVVVARG
jgi:diguanylate cyclase (GGDEF)-like protein